MTSTCNCKENLKTNTIGIKQTIPSQYKINVNVMPKKVAKQRINSISKQIPQTFTDSEVRSLVYKIDVQCSENGEIFKSSSTGYSVKFIMNGTPRHFVLTNSHAVSRGFQSDVDKTITAYLSQGRKSGIKGTVIAQCLSRDLALIQVEEKYEHMLIKSNIDLERYKDYGLNDTPTLSSDVVVYGHPYGEKGLSLTKGRLTSHGDVIYALSGGNGPMYKYDAAINHGSSGGPLLLLNKDGTLTLIGTVFEGKEGLCNYAIPVYVAYSFIKAFTCAFEKRVKSQYYIKGLRFPFEMINISNTEFKKFKESYMNSKNFKIGTNEGCMVSKSYVDGLKKGDIVLEVGQQKVYEDGTVAFGNFKYSCNSMAMLNYKPNKDKVLVKFYREGNIHQIYVKCYKLHQRIKTAENMQQKDFVRVGELLFKYANVDLIRDHLKNGKLEIDMIQKLVSKNNNPSKKNVISLTTKNPQNPLFEETKIVKMVNGIKVNSLHDILFALQKSKNLAFVVMADNEIGAYQLKSQANESSRGCEKMKAPEITFNLEKLNDHMCECGVTGRKAIFLNEKGVDCKTCKTRICAFNAQPKKGSSKQDFTLNPKYYHPAKRIDQLKMLVKE